MNNQARLNNGCVCAEGCESCTRLAEAWEAMREVTRLVAAVGPNQPLEYNSAAQRMAERALRLAEGVKRGR